MKINRFKLSNIWDFPTIILVRPGPAKPGEDGTGQARPSRPGWAKPTRTGQAEQARTGQAAVSTVTATIYSTEHFKFELIPLHSLRPTRGNTSTIFAKQPAHFQSHLFERLRPFQLGSPMNFVSITRCDKKLVKN